jgi:hypothetical protein
LVGCCKDSSDKEVSTDVFATQISEFQKQYKEVQELVRDFHIEYIKWEKNYQDSNELFNDTKGLRKDLDDWIIYRNKEQEKLKIYGEKCIELYKKTEYKLNLTIKLIEDLKEMEASFNKQRSRRGGRR